jgi:HK97 family phage prohead protease
VNRRAAAALRRAQGGYSAPVDRPRNRRAAESLDARAYAPARMYRVQPADGVADDGTWSFRAYASVVETPYDMWDMFGPYTEELASSAFDATLQADPDVAFLFNHGGMTLARTRSGTLQLGTDDTGLWYEPRLDTGVQAVRDLRSGITRGDLTECSFAFRITRGEWSPDYSAYRITGVDIDRGDVSIVNYGANPATYVVGTSDAPVDVDALDDAQALALSAALEQREARRTGVRHPHSPPTRRYRACSPTSWPPSTRSPPPTPSPTMFGNEHPTDPRRLLFPGAGFRPRCAERRAAHLPGLAVSPDREATPTE